MSIEYVTSVRACVRVCERVSQPAHGHTAYAAKSDDVGSGFVRGPPAYMVSR